MKNKLIKIKDEKAYLVNDKVFQGFEIKFAMSRGEQLKFQELLDKEGLKGKI